MVFSVKFSTLFLFSFYFLLFLTNCRWHVHAVELHQYWKSGSRERERERERDQVWDILSFSLRAFLSGSAEPQWDIETTVWIQNTDFPVAFEGESSGESSRGMLMLQSKSGQWHFGTVFQKGDIVSLLWDPLACQAVSHTLSLSFQRDRRDFKTCNIADTSLSFYKLIRKHDLQNRNCNMWI